jgi:hypothetical protein
MRALVCGLEDVRVRRKEDVPKEQSKEGGGHSVLGVQARPARPAQCGCVRVSMKCRCLDARRQPIRTEKLCMHAGHWIAHQPCQYGRLRR